MSREIMFKMVSSLLSSASLKVPGLKLGAVLTSFAPQASHATAVVTKNLQRYAFLCAVALSVLFEGEECGFTDTPLKYKRHSSNASFATDMADFFECPAEDITKVLSADDLSFATQVFTHIAALLLKSKEHIESQLVLLSSNNTASGTPVGGVGSSASSCSSPLASSSLPSLSSTISASKPDSMAAATDTATSVLDNGTSGAGCASASGGSSSFGQGDMIAATAAAAAVAAASMAFLHLQQHQHRPPVAGL